MPILPSIQHREKHHKKIKKEEQVIIRFHVDNLDTRLGYSLGYPDSKILRSNQLNRIAQHVVTDIPIQRSCTNMLMSH
jgi:hypothetical protein